MGRLIRSVVRDSTWVLGFATLVIAFIEIGTDQPSGWFWLDLQRLDLRWARSIMATIGVGLLLAPWLTGLPRKLAALGIALVSIACFFDAMRVWLLVEAGHLAESFLLPSSALVGALLFAYALECWRSRTPSPRRSLGTLVATAAFVLTGFVAQLLIFGQSDYRRPADALVVFGAKVGADGSPSLALSDRVDTACRLWKDGWASTLILSGGRDPKAPWSEPESMRQRCLEHGVPESAIVLDEGGVDTLATVRFTADLARTRAWSRVLMVSHDYHLARIKMMSVRQGLRVFTVPADESRMLARKPYFIAREMAALLVWFFTARTFE